jgi:hypothetical protein
VSLEEPLQPIPGLVLGPVRLGRGTLRIGDQTLKLTVEGASAEFVEVSPTRVGTPFLDLTARVRLGQGTFAGLWIALGSGAWPDGLPDCAPTLELSLRAGFHDVTAGKIFLDPDLRLVLDAVFTPPSSLTVKALRVESRIGEASLEGSASPPTPGAAPAYRGSLALRGIDLVTLRDRLEVPPSLQRFLSGRLEGEVRFRGDAGVPDRLELESCHLGILGGEAPLGIRCPEGGTVIDPTQSPAVGPMALVRKEIPWGGGKLLLGPPAAKQP